MASNLPAGYNPPSVFTQTSIDFAQPIVYGNNKTVTIIGVADETKSAVAVEMIRGSSSTLDNPIYGYDVSSDVTGTNATFQVRPFPIVDGTGVGRVTKDPTSVTVYVNGEIANVVSVDGAMGLITLQTPPMLNDIVTINYYFKKKDTFISGEDLSSAVPVSAKLTQALTSGANPTTLHLSLTNPGPMSNYISSTGKGVSILFRNTSVGSGVNNAVQGNGTDTLTIDVRNAPVAPATEGTIRTASELVALINTYAFTLSGGQVIASYTGSNLQVDPAVLSATAVGFAGGIGQSSAKVFQVENLPIVDGTNGGITTTTAAHISAYVNSHQVVVKSVDGITGLFTLENPVPEGATLTVDYYTNTYRDTADTLPYKDAISVQQCGFSARGIDFIADSDFVLANDTIHWGNSAVVSSVSTTSTYTPFGPKITTQVYDNKVYLVKTSQGACDGQNIVFTLPSPPMDGAGNGIVTDDPEKIVAYVGVDAYHAYQNGPVAVIRVTGATSQFMLQSAPPANTNVYVTYYESLINDATITLTCVASGPAQIGTYTAVSSKGAVLGYSIDQNVSNADFGLSSLIFPNSGRADLMGVPGYSPQEVITLTFTDSFNYTVTSDLGAAGTHGTGCLNQTYIDALTGVRFTLLDPSSGADLTAFGWTSPVSSPYVFAAGDTITLTGVSSFTTGNFERLFIPGVKMVVSDALGVASGDTAQVATYNKAGNEPNIGDVYYVTYTYAKPASAYDLQVYFSTQEENVYADYGYPSPSNKLALAAWVAFRNGAKVVGLLQVTKDYGLTDASDSKYYAALTKLQTLYPGMSRKPQIIVPLNTSQSFIPYLKKHVETQSSIKMRGECVGFFGFANNTNPSTVISLCQANSSERMVAVYPDGGIITITDNYGNSRDVVVDGSFVAVAVASLYGDPQWDVATPRTRKPLYGFKRLFRRLDPNVLNSVAQAGCTLVEQVGVTTRVRHAITTDPSNVLSVQPSVTFLKDEIQADLRDLLDPFVGKKFLNSVLTDMKSKIVSYLKSKIDSEIIQTYGTITVSRDESDSRIARVQASYIPVGELTYVMCDLLIRSRAE